MAGICLLALAACATATTPSALNPAGAGARRVAGLWWLLFEIAIAVCVVVIGLLLWAAARRRGEAVRPRAGGRALVLIAGVAIPAVILTTVYGVGLHDMRALARPASAAPLTIDITGHQWWWDVRYPGTDAVTANEIHIPVGETVHLRLRTADVVHSFWVPQLVPKTDLIAGRVNDMWMESDRVGTFRGQCAEYCGLQHAHMVFEVVVQSGADYQRWLTSQAADAPGVAAAADDAQVRRGMQVFQTASCASCHTVRGTTAHGTVGPDLTHLADRSMLAAGTLPNTTGNLAGWIANSQTVKPGNLMPPQPLSPDDLRAVVAFLEAGGSQVTPGGPISSASPSGPASAGPASGGPVSSGATPGPAPSTGGRR